MLEKEEREDSCKECVVSEQKLSEKLRENMDLKTENIKLQSKIQVLTTELNELKGKQFTYDNIGKDPESFASYTGISVEKFDVLFSFLNPGKKSENMKLYEAA